LENPAAKIHNEKREANVSVRGQGGSAKLGKRGYKGGEEEFYDLG